MAAKPPAAAKAVASPRSGIDILSVTGVVLALIAIVGGSIAKGAGLSSLWSGAAFLIVIIGTIAAILLHTPKPTFLRAMKIVCGPSSRPKIRAPDWCNRSWSGATRRAATVCSGWKT
jgi:chemotaxis protein MotA